MIMETNEPVKALEKLEVNLPDDGILKKDKVCP
jgi:hypothetical protein